MVCTVRCRTSRRTWETCEVEYCPFELREVCSVECGGVSEKTGFVVVVAGEIWFLDEVAGICTSAVVIENDFVVNCRSERSDEIGRSARCYNGREDVLIVFCPHASDSCWYTLRRPSAVQRLTSTKPGSSIIRWSGDTKGCCWARLSDEAGNDRVLNPSIIIILDRGTWNRKWRAINSEERTYHLQIVQRAWFCLGHLQKLQCYSLSIR